MALYLHGCLLKNIMKIQAKIEAWNREFEEFMILIKKRYQKIQITYIPIYKIKQHPISIPCIPEEAQTPLYILLPKIHLQAP
jgi:hypothetical protein